MRISKWVVVLLLAAASPLLMATRHPTVTVSTIWDTGTVSQDNGTSAIADSMLCWVRHVPVAMESIDTIGYSVHVTDASTVREMAMYSLNGQIQYAEARLVLSGSTGAATVANSVTSGFIAPGEYLFCATTGVNTTGILKPDSGNFEVQRTTTVTGATGGEAAATLTPSLSTSVAVKAPWFALVDD